MAIVPHPTTSLDETRLRAVLAAPRGQRFSRPGASLNHPATRRNVSESWEARQERLLRQVEGDPRVAPTLQHGAVPHWVRLARQRQKQVQIGAGAAGTAEELTLVAHPAVSRRRGRHRAPRRWWGWPALAISTALLFGQTAAEVVAQGTLKTAGPLL
jgi:hypothetical protein